MLNMSTSKQTSNHDTPMKTLLFFIVCAILVSCNPPANGDDPVRRDSIGDPVTPADTAGNHLHADSIRDDREADW